jgi:hypothetical protein
MIPGHPLITVGAYVLLEAGLSGVDMPTRRLKA